MKRLVFEKDKRTGKVTGIKIDNGALSGDGCCFSISPKLLKEACSIGIGEGFMNGRKENAYYKFGDITLITIKDDKVTAFDSYINNSGQWIGNMLQDCNLVYHCKKSDDEYKNSVRIRLLDVTRINKEGKLIQHEAHYVPLAKFFHDMQHGKISSPKEHYYYDKKEAHHKKLAADNRLAMTENLTSKQHKQAHKVISGESHQIKIEIKTLEELKGLLTFLRSDRYASLWGGNR